MNYKYFGKIIAFAAVGAFVLFVAVQPAFVSATVTVNVSGTDLNGGTAVSVDPSSSIIATVNVTGTGSGSANDWRATQWRIGSGAFTCVNHGNHNSGGTNSETFLITAPGSAGTYDAEFIAYNDDSCTVGASATRTMTGAVTVQSIAVLPFADTFGTSNSEVVAGWTEGGPANDPEDTSITGTNSSGQDQTRDTLLSNKFAKIGNEDDNGSDDEYICRTINTSGYQNIQLSYYWKQDPDADGSSDKGIVEYKTSGSCSDGLVWTNINSHNLDGSAWSSQVIFSSFVSGVNDGSFLLRFRNDSSDDNEYFRVDDVAVTGSVIATTGHLIVQKTTYPEGDTTQFPVTASGSGAITDGGAGTITDATDKDYEVTPGTYGVVEDLSALPLWQNMSNDCADIEINVGETKTCTIINKKAARITVTKTSIGDDGTFHFSGLGGDNGFDLDTTNQPEHQISSFFDVFTELDGANFSIIETVPSGWDVDNEICNLQNVMPGDEPVCAFTNTKRASFSLEKISEPDNGSFQFDLNGPAGPNSTSSQTIFSPSGAWNLSDLFSGAYSLLETILSPQDWTGSQVITCDGNGDNDPSGSIAGPFEFTLNPGDDMSCRVNNTQDALITGKKFEDMDADGIEGEDFGLPNRIIVAIRQDDPNTGEVESGNYESPLTDDGGNYTLQIPPGTYKICEAILGGWRLSYPTASTASSTSCDSDSYFEFGYELTVVAADNINGKDFGNYRNGSIYGFKWEDLNGNGVFDEDDENSEEGLDGWTIYLDLNDNGVLDDDEPSFISGEDDDGGVYSFRDLTPGTYIVREVLKNGWTQTFPGADTSFKHTVVVTSRDEETNWNFGNSHAGVARGEKWEDTNKNGARDNEEQGLDGWIITATNNELTKTATTTDGGQYQFTFGPTEMGEWTITEENRDGWMRTSEAESYQINISSGMDNDGYDFGNWKYPVFEGYKWEDIDADGGWDEEEPAVEGWAMILGRRSEPREPQSEPNGHEQMIPIEIVALSLTGSDGKFTLAATSTGNYEIFEESRNGWTMTHPAARDSFFDIEYRIDMGGHTLATSSFFDVFIESLDLPSGAIIVNDTNENPLRFGNQKLAVISDETATSTTETTSFIVAWTTDKPATSRVIYDTISHPVLGNAPNYGYSSSTIEQDIDPNKTTNHSVAVTGLTAGTTYYYRVISAASPENVGTENSFTTPSSSDDGGGGGGGGDGGIIVISGGGGLPPSGSNLPVPQPEIQTVSQPTITAPSGGNQLTAVFPQITTSGGNAPSLTPVAESGVVTTTTVEELTTVSGFPAEIPRLEFGAQFAMASMLSTLGNLLPITGNPNFNIIIFIILLFSAVYSITYYLIRNRSKSK
ncbi:MAG: hypothetical protein UW50_C0002G0001 [Candidatus Wolfebacteria bacterium GW2011_GWA1_44_24]|uniref:Fibronectin type-III domain-containing protein n=1 Tax=Candidatus Wolfebacteria bacterium GW2011_GWB1_41_12 TaxID=1619006 RepID=A0A0G0XMR1_9BACT|nr:MAG: hypothetical protein UU38_C0003G0234 [Candidatus Wolfebacteria bacterium GW2011_GWB1_41_12]KKT56324.1 MAG: hypothetical protein UW50_C0002G0001 [Candidatus Wolfebacteria bacterium GW2011_GWA1_44_24]